MNHPAKRENIFTCFCRSNSFQVFQQAHRISHIRQDGVVHGVDLINTIFDRQFEVRSSDRKLREKNLVMGTRCAGSVLLISEFD